MGVTGLLLAVELWAVRPYLGTEWVGAGDAYHYALQLEDMRTQVRAGVFPVLVGQSIFGFNGNIHTLRTAPLFVHVGLVVDLISGGRLETFALENAVAVLAALGCAASMFLVLLGRGLRNLGLVAVLAAAYATSVGVVGTLLAGDMYATLMAAPWLPVVIAGLIDFVERGWTSRRSALTVIAYALVWYAHPPTAALLTPVVMIALVVRWIVDPSRGRLVAGAVAAACGWAALCGYLFVSVGSMRLAYFGREQGLATADVLGLLPRLWPALLGPVSAHGGAPTDLHPGWAVLAVALAGLILLRTRTWRAAWPALALAGYLLALMPGPSSYLLWHLIPESVITFVNPWPHQRIVPIAAALVLIWGGESIDGWAGPRRGRRGLTLVLLLVAVGANLAELSRLMPHRFPDARRILPANVTLTRSSYLLFNSFPAYFSNGFVAPEEEVRILDEAFRVRLTDADSLFSQPAEVGPWFPVKPQEIVQMRPGLGWAIEFNFPDPAAVGEITLVSGEMRRVFAVPESGAPLAFGSTPAASHRLMVAASAQMGPQIVILCSLRGVTARLRFYREDALPIRVLSLVPFVLRVHSPIPGWVETPKVALPGYTATVNGRAVAVTRSPQGLVSIPIGAGDAVIRLGYHPWYLRAAYFVSLAAFALVPIGFRLPIWEGVYAGLVRVLAVGGRWAAWLWARGTDRGFLLVSASLTGAVALGGLAALLTYSSHGLDLAITLPLRPAASREPLLVLGDTGAADVVYLVYDDPTHLRIGYDHWSRGGPLSAPILHRPGESVRVEIRTPGLHARWPIFDRLRAPPTTQIGWNGRVVLGGNLAAYRDPEGRVDVGLNRIGASTCGERFSGQIWADDAFWRWQDGLRRFLARASEPR